jgi:hypothetical protein
MDVVGSSFLALSYGEAYEFCSELKLLVCSTLYLLYSGTP